VLHLNSHGGRVAEADLMAAKVRARRLVTYVSEECLSACTHIFLAGRERWVSERGKLGFHQPSFPGLDRETAAGVIEQERRDLLSMGLSSDFVSKALDTPNDKMWRPSHKELLAARAISGISDGSRFATSGYSASLSAAEREEALLKLPLFASLKRFEPETFRELMARVADGYSQGDSEEQIVATTRGLIAKSVRRKLPYASDTDVMQAVDLRIGYMEGLKSADPESCVALEDDSKGARLKVDLAKLYPALASKELALNQALIESKMFGTHSIPNDRQVEPYLEKVANRMTTRTGLRLGLLEKAKLEPAEYGPFCEVALAFYREVRRLPIGEATALMRNIYADASK
jgi:hypothetical protein